MTSQIVIAKSNHCYFHNISTLDVNGYVYIGTLSRYLFRGHGGIFFSIAMISGIHNALLEMILLRLPF